MIFFLHTFVIETYSFAFFIIALIVFIFTVVSVSFAVFTFILSIEELGLDCNGLVLFAI